MLGLKNKNFWNTYWKNLLIATLIFVVLYSSFLFGGELYGYADIGADTTEQYLPVIAFETNTLKQGENGQYNLQYGLGKYVTGLFREYLDPTNLPLLLFGEDYLHIGILATTYVRYALILLFALLFFRRLLQENSVASICALLWTFSGYAVLWGQHYSTLRSIVLFTIAVYGFQLFLDEDKKRFLVIPLMACLAGNSYYRLYMACFFLLIYGVLYLALKGKTFLQILKKAGQFVLVMIPVVCICAYYLLPAVVDFFSSSRTGVLNTAGVQDPLFYDVRVILSFVARVLSANLIGTGNSFLGPYNYYETAILNVSLLFIFAEVYLLTHKKYWKQTLCITIFCVLALCMPAVSRILQFITNAQRWTYLLCFAQVIAIGYALRDVLARCGEKGSVIALWRSVILADMILAGILFVFYKVNLYVGGWYLKMDICRILLIVVGMYHLVFLFYGRQKVFYLLLVAAVAAELMVCNYATINNRQTVTLDAWYEDMYNDGTEEVVEWIHQQDDSLYRIGRTGSREFMAALMQEYNGLSAYDSLNTAQYVNLARSYGYANAGNLIRMDGMDFLANTMLGAKYVIAENDGYFHPDYYEKIYDDGTFQVYENRYWLGFGYVYPQKTESYVNSVSSRMDKLNVLSQGYYMTEDISAGETLNTKKIDLIPYLSGQENCQVTVGGGLQITGTADYMKLYFDVPEMEGNWIVTGATVTMNTQISSHISLFGKSEAYDWGQCGDTTVAFGAGEQTVFVENTTMDTPEELQLYCSHLMQDMSITSIQLHLLDATMLQESLRVLSDSKIADMTQERNTFAATARNPYEETAMLCIPLLYDKNWEAAVDGQQVPISNINGGLVGIDLPAGDHEVTLTYRDPVRVWGNVISILSIAGYVAAVWVLKKRKRI